MTSNWLRNRISVCWNLSKISKKMNGTLVFHSHSCGASKKYEALWSYHPPRSAEKGSLAGNPSCLPLLFPSK
jgi:hypothetical protein